MIDTDEENRGGKRRWSVAISVTSHLTAQCFNGQRLVRGQKKRRAELCDLFGRMQPGGLSYQRAHLSL